MSITITDEMAHRLQATLSYYVSHLATINTSGNPPRKELLDGSMKQNREDRGFLIDRLQEKGITV